MSDHEPKKSGELPVTWAMLQETENSLKSEITSVSLEVRSVDAKVGSLEKKMESLHYEMKSDMADLRSDMHKMLALMEEQNSRNKFVLDGYASLDQRVSALERPKA